MARHKVYESPRLSLQSGRRLKKAPRYFMGRSGSVRYCAYLIPKGPRPVLDAMGIRAISSYSLSLRLSGCNAKPFSKSRLGPISSVVPRLGVWQSYCLSDSMNMRENSRVDEKHWRKLCEMVAAEPDPRRLSELVDLLLNELDARRQELRETDTASSSSASDHT